MSHNKYDFIDIGTGISALCFTAANIQLTPFWAIPAFGIWGAFYWFRRTRSYSDWATKVTSSYKLLEYAQPYLLPPPDEDETYTLTQTKPLDVNIVNTSGKETTRLAGWYNRVTTDPTTQPMKSIGSVTKTLQAIDNEAVVAKKTSKQNMAEVLAVMPSILPFNHPKIPNPPTPTSVLVGYDPIGKRFVWADFGKYDANTIHAFIAGQVGAGKDSMMRLWFTQLTMNNTPDDIQFVIIDAKGEWITPALKEASHMFVPPVGGFSLEIQRNDKGKRKLVDLANEAIEDALIDAIDMLQKRADDFQKVGATNIQAYEKKTGKKLPLLFIIATDVGTNLEGILEQLIKFAVLKGRSLGVRMIISFQSASGEDTSWRGNIGLVLSGFQGQGSADAPNIGIPVRAMKYRPSELPNVDHPANRGLFVFRKGLDQCVVRAAYLPDDVFEQYCETQLPRKTDFNQNEFLHTMLMSYQPPQAMEVAAVPTPVLKLTLTREQSVEAANFASQGITPSNITKMLGFTSSKRYNEMLPIVTAIHQAVVTRKILVTQRNKQ